MTPPHYIEVPPLGKPEPLLPPFPALKDSKNSSSTIHPSFTKTTNFLINLDEYG
jgi:hypothetical protein